MKTNHELNTKVKKLLKSKWGEFDLVNDEENLAGAYVRKVCRETGVSQGLWSPATSIEDAMELTSLPLNGCRVEFIIKGGAYNLAVYDARGKHIRTWIVSYPSLPHAITEAFIAAKKAAEASK